METAALPTELCPYTNDAHNAYLALWASALELLSRFELVDEGFADPCLTTWPRHHIGVMITTPFGAADEARTRYLHLGKVALYQMSYGRIFGAFTLAPVISDALKQVQSR